MTIRHPANHRPSPTEDVAYGVPALQLVEMVKAEAAFDATAISQAWDFEPPTSTPVPHVDIPREVALRSVGGWYRHLDSKRAAWRALRIKSEAPAEAAGEPNAASTYGDSLPEIASLDVRGKTPLKTLEDPPNKSPRRGRPRKVHIVRPEAYAGSPS